MHLWVKELDVLSSLPFHLCDLLLITLPVDRVCYLFGILHKQLAKLFFLQCTFNFIALLGKGKGRGREGEGEGRGRGGERKERIGEGKGREGR